MRPRPGIAVLALVLATVGPAAGQSSGDGYLFGAPPAVLTVHGGYARASAGSDVFTFSTEELTLGRGDFSGPSLGAELAIRLTPRFDVVLGGEYTGREARSESRSHIGADDLPIEQATTFQRVPVTAAARAYLSPRGRSIGRFAWIPASTAPFVEAGAGAVWYRFRQEGEFVDYRTCDADDLCEIFADTFESSGWGPALHAGAGVDVTLTPRFGLTARARYGWGRSELGRTFEDFDDIDLSGLSATVGLNLRF